MNFGLSENSVSKIKNILLQFPEIEEAILYGSRAKGNFKDRSDIDLTLKGDNLNLELLAKISSRLDDLHLPYTIDMSLINHIKNPDLLDHIKRVGKIFFYNTRKISMRQG